MENNRNQLDDLVNVNYSISKEHGFFEDTGMTYQLMLIGTEIAEALESVDIDCDRLIELYKDRFMHTMKELEDYRATGTDIKSDDTKPVDIDNLEEEVADILIRVFSMIGYFQKELDIDMDVIGRVFKKMKKNKDRPYKHNKNF